jgi:hypothetical protein
MSLLFFEHARTAADVVGALSRWRERFDSARERQSTPPNIPVTLQNKALTLTSAVIMWQNVQQNVQHGPHE